MRSKLIWGWVVMLGLGVAGCRSASATQPSDPAPAAAVPRSEPAPQPATACEAPGVVVAERVLEVAAPHAGRVRLAVERGADVAEGSIVAYVDDPQLDGELSVASASLERARAERGVATHRERRAGAAVDEVQQLGEHARGQELRQARHDREVLRAELRSATADVQQRRARAAVARHRHDAQTIESRFAARVADVYVDDAAWVAAGQPLMRLVAPQPGRLRFAVEAADMGAIDEGQRVQWSTPGNERRGIARIDVVAPEVDAHAGVLVVEATIDDPTTTAELPSGAAVSVTLPCHGTPEPAAIQPRIARR